jgi:hypothetical protein
MQHQQIQNPRPPTQNVVANTSEPPTCTIRPILSTNGLPQQYGTVGTAGNNLTQRASGTTIRDEDDDLSESSTDQSNKFGISTDDLNALVEFRKGMTTLSSLVPDTDNRKMNMSMTDCYEDMQVHCNSTVYSHVFAMFQNGQYFSNSCDPMNSTSQYKVSKKILDLSIFSASSPVVPGCCWCDRGSQYRTKVVPVLVVYRYCNPSPA